MTPELEKQIREWVANSEGWMEPERAIEMAEIILERKPKIIVEIGVFGGRSLVSQALALKHLGEGKIYGIDPWQLQPALEGENQANRDWWSSINLDEIHQKCMNGIWHRNLQDHAVIIRARSSDCFSLFPGNVDMLFLDGNHSEESSCRDATLCALWVRQGGTIIMDDCDWKSTKKAQGLLEQSCDIKKVSKDGHYKIYHKR